METSDANAFYKALQVTWNRRLANGLSFGFSYTLSKSMDGKLDLPPELAPDTYDTAANLWGPSEFDTRHVVVINYVYALPFFKNSATVPAKLLGGWQISGVNQFQTGTPCKRGQRKRLCRRWRSRQFWLRQCRSILDDQRNPHDPGPVLQ